MEAYGVQGLPNSVYFWEIDGGVVIDTIFGLNNDSIVVQWDFERRNHSITVTEETEFGCFGVPVGGNVAVNAPVVDLQDQAVCEDTVTMFDGTTAYVNPVSYLWPDGSTGATYSTGTAGYVWVKVTGTDLCADYDSAYLTVNPLPDISIGPDTVLCGTETLVLDAGNFAEYQWSTNDISHSIVVDGKRVEPEAVWVNVTDFNGCKGSDTLILEVCDAALLFHNMPNTITPGDDGGTDDGYNDTWVIPNIEMFPDAVLEIFDRWGRLVFRTDDIFNNPWKGQDMKGKNLPMDAYFYVLDIKVAHVKPVTGYVNVVR
jgi:gliding motility-associated-like protein